MSDRSEIEALKAHHGIVDVAGRYTTLRRAGREWVGLSPFKAERTPSFYVHPEKGTFYCFCTGQGGDVIRLVELAESLTTADAIRRLKDEAGIAGMSDERKAEMARRRAEAAAMAEARDRAEKARMAASAAKIVSASVAGHGTPVETYLRHRGVDTAALAAVYGWPRGVPPTLRFVPDLDYWHHTIDGHGRDRMASIHRGPAMIGVIARDPDDGAAPIIGVHRTWMAPGGRGKAIIIDPAGKPTKVKLTLGHVFGLAGWLSTEGDGLVIGEGYETTLCVMSVMARAGRRVAGASALSLGNLAGAGLGQGRPHPERPGRRLPAVVPDMSRPGVAIPARFRNRTILVDADGRDPLSTQALVERAARRWRAEGCSVRAAVPELGSDFADMAHAGRADVIGRVEGAV